MRSKSYEINVGQAEKFARRLTIRASRQRVFDAIGAIDGPRHWWTTIVNGSAAVGERLCFGSTGLDEQIVMRVDAVHRPKAVSWSCIAHTRGDEWKGTQLHFRLNERGPKICWLDFEHVGISPEAVAKGWDHFLASLAAYAEHGSGSPFGTGGRSSAGSLAPEDEGPTRCSTD